MKKVGFQITLQDEFAKAAGRNPDHESLKALGTVLKKYDASMESVPVKLETFLAQFAGKMNPDFLEQRKSAYAKAGLMDDGLFVVSVPLEYVYALAASLETGNMKRIVKGSNFETLKRQGNFKP
jgi:hypothetical protein